MNKLLVYIGINIKTNKRFIGISKSEEEISKKYSKYSIVAFCKNELEAKEIHDKYIEDLNALKDDNYENKVEKAVIKDEVFEE